MTLGTPHTPTARSMILVILLLLDGIITFYSTQTGNGIEANPIQAWLFSRSPLIALLMKSFIVVLVVIGLRIVAPRTIKPLIIVWCVILIVSVTSAFIIPVFADAPVELTCSNPGHGIGGGTPAVYPNNYKGQTFTLASRSIITSIEVDISHNPTFDIGNVTLWLSNTSGGLPTGSSIGSVTRDGDILPNDPPFVCAGAYTNDVNYRWIFSSPITLNAGQYAFYITQDESGFDPHFPALVIGNKGSSYYTNGTHVFSDDAGATWSYNFVQNPTLYDAYFKVWGNVAPTPTATPTPSFCATLSGLNCIAKASGLSDSLGHILLIILLAIGIIGGCLASGVPPLLIGALLFVGAAALALAFWISGEVIITIVVVGLIILLVSTLRPGQN